ncbi:GGDEF domain-containing protein [Granulicella sibirica]|uniref:diguanylate cyclase n=1 Tax=Granulicella sibirica TaxID=2479048 RepID=A0A4Q0T1N6_9BACT|nr:GGDEF domain-containing protein [Granulicella sibirica]RXH57493.1 hypothetical protein GRAN_0803 [Granulicella sibirica]
MGAGQTPQEIANTQQVLAAGIALVAIQAVAGLFLPEQGVVTYAGIGCCYALAGLTSFQRMFRYTGTMRVRWMMVALGFAVGVLGFMLKIAGGSVFPSTGKMAGFPEVLLLLRGLPFLVAASLSNRENSRVFIRLDLAQAVLTVGLAFIALLFAFPVPGGGYAPIPSLVATDRLMVANLLIAVAATVRIFARRDSGERRFFRRLCGFLWANALAITFVNRVLLHRAHVFGGSPLLVISDLPVLWMAVAASRPSKVVTSSGTVHRDSFVDAGSSFLFPFSVFLMAASIVPVHLYLGMGFVTLTFVLYAVRATILQTRYLAVQEELRKANERSRDQALQDGLTGIPNRRNFDQTLDREWRRAQRTNQPLSLLMIDVDHFKQLNDSLGHPTGDSCLRQLASLFRTRLGREQDFAARYGGEEFTILLMDTGIEGARTVAEGLRRTVSQYEFTHMGRPCGEITISIGVATKVPTLEEASSTLVELADEALYSAKNNGRNRVEVQVKEMARRA